MSWSFSLILSYNPCNYYLLCWGGDAAAYLPAGSVLSDQHHAAMCALFTPSQTAGERFIVQISWFYSWSLTRIVHYAVGEGLSASDGFTRAWVPSNFLPLTGWWVAHVSLEAPTSVVMRRWASTGRRSLRPNSESLASISRVPDPGEDRWRSSDGEIKSFYCDGEGRSRLIRCGNG